MFAVTMLSAIAVQVAQPEPARSETERLVAVPAAPQGNSASDSVDSTANAPSLSPRFYSAADFRGDCAMPARIEACLAFGAAVRDTSLAYQRWQGFREFCIPPETSQSELRDATLHYLNIHPREADALAASVVVLALRDAFPCETPGKKPSSASEKGADRTDQSGPTG